MRHPSLALMLALACLAGGQSTDPTTEVGRLRDRANAIAKSIGELTASGELANSDDAVAQLKRMVDELTGIRASLKRLEELLSSERAGTRIKDLEVSVGEIGKVRSTGYLQFQYNSANAPGLVNNAFRVRRAQFYAVYNPDPKTMGRIGMELSSGSGQGTPVLKDAYVAYSPNGLASSRRTTYILGQQPMILGYELARSSSIRTWPEFSQSNRELFSSERMRGAVFQRVDGGTTISLGVIDALTTTDPEQVNLAAGPGGKLAAIAAVRQKIGAVELGVSALMGRRSKFQNGTSPSAPEVDRRFLVLDANVKPFRSPIDIHAEFLIGRDRVPTGQSSVSMTAKNLMAWHVQLDYKLNNRYALMARYEQFDRDRDMAGDAFRLFGIGFVQELTPSIRLMASHEWDMDGLRTVFGQRHYGVTTLRVQYRF